MELALPTLLENHFDSCVTDPPYGLKFMGKKWDYNVPTVEQWQEVYRVMKPGAFLLSFGGTRTYHRMVVNIEDAGFEIRDQIQWLYGSGFPKSLDVGKAVDKLQGNERKTTGTNGVTRIAGGMFVGENEGTREYTKGNSPYEGFGTALKPANEPICLARKPIEGTVAANVLKWGTGGLNIDGCRVELNGEKRPTGSGQIDSWREKEERNDRQARIQTFTSPAGRFPANVIHDGSDEVVRLFPNTKSVASGYNWEESKQGNVPITKNIKSGIHFGDSGSAARFFYVAKASKAERGEGNNHVTVKPLKLMCYLCRLVTPPGGTVLDCYVGSGTTGVAAQIEGFDFIGIDKDIRIATRRIEDTDPLFQAVGL